MVSESVPNESVPSESVHVDRDGAVATLTLDRQQAMNALDHPTKVVLRDRLRELAADSSVRAVVLTGAGDRAFCTGQDLKEHVALLQAGDPAPLSTVTEHYNPIVLAIATMPKPVIAAVNGMAAGAGASLAFAADFRVAASRAVFLLAFARIGLSVDTGSSWTLPRLIGHAKATELAMLAEPISAHDALAIGLVTEVVADEDLAARAAELAHRLAAGPTVAYGAIKSALHFSAGVDLTTALTREGELMAATGGSQDHKDAVAAFVAKQQATFSGR
ncbi:MAG: enoyl-CoA hydratase/isomerase family protein [Geodermatophilaceae bacterium]|nr:enoyl-CoA hydratase/isomerase family protein [Geodermatophilaceae bacterium]